MHLLAFRSSTHYHGAMISMPFLRSFPWPRLVLPLLAALALLPWWRIGGLISGHDLLFEMVRLVEYQDALWQQVIPRFSPHTYGGFGSPLFLYYSPLFVFAASVLRMVTPSLEIAVMVWFWGLLWASGAAVRSLMVSVIGKWHALLLAAIWMFSPYIFIDLFQRNAFSEATAMLLIPVVILAVSRFAQGPGRGRFFLAVTVSTALLLAHNLTLLMLGVFACVGAVVWSVVMMVGGKVRWISWPSLWRGTQVFLLSGGLAAWFLLPAFFEKNLVHIEEVITGKFVYSLHFPQWMDMLTNPAVAQYALVPLLLSVVALGCLLLRRKGGKIRLLWAGLLWTLLGLFLVSPLSRFVWDNLPLLHFLQFPWRFSLMISLVVILLLAGMMQWGTGKRWIWVLPALVLAHHVGVWGAVYLLPGGVRGENLPVMAQDIALRDLPATVGREYWPRSIGLDRDISVFTPLFRGKIPGQRPGLTPTLYAACGSDLPEGERAVANFPFLLAEGMHVREGFLFVPARGSVPPEHCVRLQLGWTPVQRWSWSISLVSLLVLGFFCWKGPWDYAFSTRSPLSAKT